MIADRLVVSQHRAQILRPFSATESSEHLQLLFSVERRPQRLDFTFELRGTADLEALVIPAAGEASHRRRRDGLWNHTCFEVFVAAADRSSYLELNLSPSGDWNAYAFERYRVGGNPVEGVSPPLLGAERSSSGPSFAWHGSLRGDSERRPSAGELHELLNAPSLLMGATAVLEYTSGARAHWALVHAGTKPDFHLRESFLLAL
jgi:hypothetical protein